MVNKTNIKTVIFVGDSYSDTGQLSRRYLLGFIPLGWLGGLDHSSTKCRFSDGLTWVDYFKKCLIEKYYSGKDLSQDLYWVKFNGNFIMRTYTDGGMYDSEKNFPENLKICCKNLWDLIKSLPNLICSIRPIVSRFILSKLSDMIDLLLKHDKSHKVSIAHKQSSLVIFWTGANDFFTVNIAPNVDVIKQSLESKEREILRLIQNGYRSFCLFNMPEPSLIPRFFDKNPEEKASLAKSAADYNAGLQQVIERLQAKAADVSITLFTLDKELKQIIENLHDYNFTPEGLKKIMKECSKQDEHAPKGKGCGTEHVYWDDVHPTQALHSVLYKKFDKHFYEQYEYVRTSLRSSA